MHEPASPDSVDFAFTNPGGIRANIEAGEVTYAELFAVQPFDNGLVTMDLTGEQIYRLLEQQLRADGSSTILQISGLKYTYNPLNPVGSKVTSATLPDGTTLDPTTTYTVAVNGFLATGGDGFTVFEEGARTCRKWAGTWRHSWPTHRASISPSPPPIPTPN